MGEQYITKPFAHVIEALFRIPNKQGVIVDFKLNNIQRHLHDILLKHRRVDILKFRQGGITTFVMAYFLIECMTKYCTAVMIAHDREHTEKLLQKCRLMLKLMKGPKPQLRKENDRELYFEKTHSTFFIGTAGNTDFGRSATITHLHCSEYAFWKDPVKLMTGLMQAVPHETGVVIKECTANGYGTVHHKEFMEAWNGQSRFKAVFYPWYVFDEYKSPVPPDFEPTKEELELIEKFDLTYEQLQWRREKLRDMGNNVDLFKQEYPATVEEAFLMSGGLVFSDVPYTETPRFKYNETLTNLTNCVVHTLDGHPNPDLTYVFGIDVGGGTGRDYSVIQGVCVETKEQVLVAETNRQAPPTFALSVATLGELFNYALLIPEANSHGLSLLDILKKEYPNSKIYHYLLNPHSRVVTIRWGFNTEGKTKYQLINTLQQVLPHLTIYHYKTYKELQNYQELGGGKFGPSTVTDHDDHVIALALTALELQKHIKHQSVVKYAEQKHQTQQTTETAENEKVVKREELVGVKVKKEPFVVTFDDIFGKRKVV